MTKSKYELLDTRGEKWAVFRDDPAFPLCTQLAGWEADGEEGIILPPAVLIRGRATEADVIAVREELEGAISALLAFPGSEADKEVLRAHASKLQTEIALGDQGGTLPGE